MFKLSLLEIQLGMSNLIWLLQLKVVPYLCFKGKPYWIRLISLGEYPI